MNLKETILERSREFLNKKLEEQRLNITVNSEEEELFDLETLELQDISFGNITDLNKSRTFLVFIHHFIVNGKEIVDIDLLESDANAKSVVPTNDYKLFFDPNSHTEFHREFDINDYGLSESLNIIDYESFFHDGYDLVSEFKQEYFESESKRLLSLVKDSFPGLVEINHSAWDDDFNMIFSTGAELTVSRDNILSGFFKANR